MVSSGNTPLNHRCSPDPKHPVPMSKISLKSANITVGKHCTDALLGTFRLQMLLAPEPHGMADSKSGTELVRGTSG